MSLADMLQEYKDAFEGDRHLEGKLKFEIDLQVQPVLLLKCRVSLGLMEPLKEEFIIFHFVRLVKASAN